jgi:hypothetical protein
MCSAVYKATAKLLNAGVNQISRKQKLQLSNWNFNFDMAERFFDQAVLALDILDQALHSGYAGYSGCQ